MEGTEQNKFSSKMSERTTYPWRDDLISRRVPQTNKAIVQTTGTTMAVRRSYQTTPMFDPTTSGPLGSNYVTVLAVVAGVTTLCAFVTVIAACYLKMQTRKKQKQAVIVNNNINDGMGSATYMELMQRDSNTSITANVIENQTYEDVGEHAEANPPKNDPLRRTNLRSTHDTSVRYSSPPMLPSEEGGNAVFQFEFQSYEQVVLKEEGDEVKFDHDEGTATTIDKGERADGVEARDLTSGNDHGITLDGVNKSGNGGYEVHCPSTNKQDAYEVANLATEGIQGVSSTSAAANESYQTVIKKPLEESGEKGKKGYVDVDYSTNDVIATAGQMNPSETNNNLDSTSGKSSSTPAEQDDGGMPSISNTHPAYFTLTSSQLPSVNVADSYLVASPVLTPEEERQHVLPSDNNTSSNSEMAGNSLNMVHTDLDIDPIPQCSDMGSVNNLPNNNPDVVSNSGAVPVSSPGFANGQGAFNTGNIYQQVPLTPAGVNINADSPDVYEKLNRGFLAKTLSH